MRGSLWAFSGSELLTKKLGLKRLSKGMQNSNPRTVPKAVAKKVLRDMGLEKSIKEDSVFIRKYVGTFMTQITTKVHTLFLIHCYCF